MTNSKITDAQKAYLIGVLNQGGLLAHYAALMVAADSKTYLRRLVQGLPSDQEILGSDLPILNAIWDDVSWNGQARTNGVLPWLDQHQQYYPYTPYPRGNLRQYYYDTIDTRRPSFVPELLQGVFEGTVHPLLLHSSHRGAQSPTYHAILQLSGVQPPPLCHIEVYCVRQTIVVRLYVWESILDNPLTRAILGNHYCMSSRRMMGECMRIHHLHFGRSLDFYWLFHDEDILNRVPSHATRPMCLRSGGIELQDWLIGTFAKQGISLSRCALFRSKNES